MAMLDRVSSPEMVQDEVRKIEKYLSLCEGKISDVLSEYVLELCEDIQVDTAGTGRFFDANVKLIFFVLCSREG